MQRRPLTLPGQVDEAGHPCIEEGAELRASLRLRGRTGIWPGQQPPGLDPVTVARRRRLWWRLRGRGYRDSLRRDRLLRDRLREHVQRISERDDLVAHDHARAPPLGNP